MKYQKKLLGLFLFLFTTTAIFAQPDADKPTKLKDQQILDDLIVDGSACIGQDCVNGENFGFKTLRLKENNLRIHFDDTSTSASFPSADWCIQINDSTNGGANYYSIVHENTGRRISTLEANAPQHSLYVDDGGRVGFGTATPVAELHVVDGDTPTLRLEQDGSSGFAQQTWDVAGNEAGFFVRDASNGSTLPFRVLPGAASQSLVIDGNSEVGINAGTNPSARLHVVGKTADDFVAKFTGQNTTNNKFDFNAGANPAQLFLSTDSQNRRIIGANAGGAPQTQINLRNTTIRFFDESANCDIDPSNATQSCMSDRNLKNNIQNFTIDNILDRIAKVPVTTYRWNTDANLEDPELRLGLIAQDFYSIFKRGEQERIRDNEVRMALWLGVQDLHKKDKEIDQILEEKDNQIVALQDQVNVLAAKLEKLTELIEVNKGESVLDNIDKATIGQNYPNPFEEATTIDYYIPSNVSSAEIHFLDSNGKILKKEILSGPGNGQMTLKIADIPSGNYSYSLIVEGRILDTKQMVIVK